MKVTIHIKKCGPGRHRVKDMEVDFEANKFCVECFTHGIAHLAANDAQFKAWLEGALLLAEAHLLTKSKS